MPGHTYRVDYSYKVTGKGNGSINVGLAATTNYAFNKAHADGYGVELSSRTLETYVQNFSGGINLPAESETGWIQTTDYLTVPQGSDLSKNKYLSLYVRYGGRTTEPVIYLDNIKVTAFPDTTVSRPAEYFQNGMMFQQNKPMNLWGTAANAESNIKAELYKTENPTTAIEVREAAIDSKTLDWELSFDARQGNYESYILKIYDGETLIGNYSDILIGELWLATGQSNMEYAVSGDPRSDYYTANENIRIFSYRNLIGGSSSALPATEQKRTSGSWIAAKSTGAIQNVSAIAYSMCNKLQKELNIPVGFMHVARGGSTIETWLLRSSIEGNDVIKAGLASNNKY